MSLTLMTMTLVVSTVTQKPRFVRKMLFSKELTLSRQSNGFE